MTAATGCYWHGDTLVVGRILAGRYEIAAQTEGSAAVAVAVGRKGMVEAGVHLISFRAEDTAHLRGVKITCDGDLATLTFAGGPTVTLTEDDAGLFGVELIQLAGAA